MWDTWVVDHDTEPSSDLVLRPVGRVRSTLRRREDAPKQGDEGSPEAWIDFDAAVAPALADLAAGDEVLVLTWLDQADRGVLRTQPRDDPDRPELGVFSTRSPDRPNPIGLHRVGIVAVEGASVRVRDLEALDATPVLDVKPVLDPSTER
jgi:tRNA-Thr(GGU) m(6)t(6)A37 methyltransferase TsaA